MVKNKDEGETAIDVADEREDGAEAAPAKGRRKATADTGLAANDVFFFGNEIGDTGSSNTATVAKVSSSDVTGAQTHGASLKANIPVTNVYDFNKDGQVTSADVTIALTPGSFSALSTLIDLINACAWGLRRTLPCSIPGKL